MEDNFESPNIVSLGDLVELQKSFIILFDCDFLILASRLLSRSSFDYVLDLLIHFAQILLFLLLRLNSFLILNEDLLGLRLRLWLGLFFFIILGLLCLLGVSLEPIISSDLRVTGLKIFLYVFFFIVRFTSVILIVFLPVVIIVFRIGFLFSLLILFLVIIGSFFFLFIRVNWVLEGLWRY
jgi:hypothetical protein